MQKNSDSINIQETVLQTVREISLAEICATFIDEELLASSQQTQTWYRCRLGLFVSALGPDRPLSTISKNTLLTWWRSLEVRTLAKPPSLADETFHGYVRAVRRLFKWVYDQHLSDTDLHLFLKLPKIPERQRKGISDANAVRLITAAQDNPRDYAILLFLESSGARRGGVASMTLEDINLDAAEPFCRRVTVHEKGEKIRTVVVSPECLVAMRAWMDVRRSKTEFVFVDERPGHDTYLLPGAINQIIARYKKLAGVKGRCSPHQWRHHWCRSRLKEKMPLSVVSQLAGHSTVVVTAMFYGNLLVDELQDAYDACYRAPMLEE